MSKANKLKKSLAVLSAAALMVTGLSVPSVSAAHLDPDHDNNYDNFAEALQLALCFYDANKCGDEVANDGYFSWRGNCHVKDKEIPLQPMNPMPELYGEKQNDGSNNGEGQQDPDNKDKKDDDTPMGEGSGDGGASAAAGLYEGVNMSQEFIDANRKYLDPDGNGTLDLTGGWHDAGDHVKFGLPGSFSASTVGWGYYEFREDYIEIGLQKHIEDTLRWINDYYMKATFLDDDGNVVGYCYQVGEGQNDHNYWCAPELQVDGTLVATSSCAVKRPAYFATTEMPAPDQVAGASASLAIHYLNFKDTAPEYAAKALKYAKALYEFAVATHQESWNPGETPSSLVLGFDGGFYHSSYDYDELAWAAVWLYYATVAEDETKKQEAYDKYIMDIIAVDESVTLSGDSNYDPEAHTGQAPSHPYTGYMKRIIRDTGNTWQNIWVHCWDTVWGGVFAKLAPITNTARDWYIFRYNLEYWAGCPATEDTSKWGYEPMHSHKYFGTNDYLWNLPMTADEIPALEDKEGGDFIAKSPYGWAVVAGYGSARYNTAAGLCACVYAKTTGDETFLPWAKAQMEYILGKNPMGYAYEVGYEYDYANHPHHRAAHCSATQSMDDPDPQEHILYGALVGGPDLKDFHDDITKEYIYNEVSDDYNAGFCGDLAGLYHYYGAKGKEHEKDNHIIPDWDMSLPKNDGGTCEAHPEIFVTAAKNQEKEDGLQVKIVMHNSTTNPPRFMDDMAARYYFNISELLEAGEDASFISCRLDYDAVDAMSSGKEHVTISDPIKYDDDGTYYVEISWKGCRFYGSRVIQFCFVSKQNPEKDYKSIWDSSNDYSYPDLISFADDNDAAIATDRIPVYVDGVLVNGVEPDGTKPETDTNGRTGVLYGDVDVNGAVELRDAVLLAKAIASSDGSKLSVQGRANADVVLDNTIAGSDLTLLLKFLAGSVEYDQLGKK